MRRPSRDHAARTDEQGFTFIEVLITLAFLSFAFIAIIGALGSMVVGSDQHARITTAEGAIRSAAEFVKSQAEVAYVPCHSDPLAAYQGALSTLPMPSNFTVSIVAVQASNGDSPATFRTDGTCPPSDRGTQLLSVKVEVTGPRATTQTLDIVKRNQ